MAVSYLSLRYSFICPNPECHNQFEERLGALQNADSVTCPNCGIAIDIRESRQTGDLAQVLREVREIDKKGRSR